MVISGLIRNLITLVYRHDLEFIRLLTLTLENRNLSLLEFGRVYSPAVGSHQEPLQPNLEKSFYRLSLQRCSSWTQGIPSSPAADIEVAFSRGMVKGIGALESTWRQKAPNDRSDQDSTCDGQHWRRSYFSIIPCACHTTAESQWLPCKTPNHSRH